MKQFIFRHLYDNAFAGSNLSKACLEKVQSIGRRLVKYTNILIYPVISIYVSEILTLFYMAIFQAAELLRHPLLQPFLAQYSNLSPVFLPVKSEMDSKCKSPRIPLSEKYAHNKKVLIKESNGIAEQGRKTRLPPVSSSKKNLPIPSEPSKFNDQRPRLVDSGCSSESSTLTDQQEDSAEQKEQPQQEQIANDDKTSSDQERNKNSNVYINWLVEDEMSANRAKERTSANSETASGDKTEGKVIQEHKAQAMESLLELCAQLLKRERLEELAGILKPFAEEAVSSRETAIWLTKGLMKIQKPNGGEAQQL